MVKYSHSKRGAAGRRLLAVLLWIAVGCGGACQARKGELGMTDSIDQPSSQKSGPQPAAPTRITPGGDFSVTPKATPAAKDNGCVRPFCNDELNSRSGTPLPAGAWGVRWQSELENGFEAAFVVNSADRIIVAGAYAWKMFDYVRGQRLATDGLGNSHLLLDPARELFYHPNPSGLILARNASDGNLVFATGAFSGNQFKRAYFARRDRRMLILSVEYLGQPHGGHVPNLSVLQVQDLGEPPRPDENKLLTEARTLAELSWETVQTAAAARGETAVVAIPDHVYITDLSLSIRRDLTGEFAPLHLSLDGEGRIYLLLRQANRNLLWVLSPNGELLMSFKLPPDLRVSPIPPIVGYNHRVYIIGSNRVLAINPDGKLAWAREMNGQRGGAVVTSDDQLLVADGRELVVFNNAGQRRVLFTFANDLLYTPPVLTKSGDIIVASQQRLYLLGVTPNAK